MGDEVDDKKPVEIEHEGPLSAAAQKLVASVVLAGAVGSIFGGLQAIDALAKNGISPLLAYVLVIFVGLIVCSVVLALTWRPLADLSLRTHQRLRKLAVAAIHYRPPPLKFVGLLSTAVPSRRKFVIVVIALAAAVAIWRIGPPIGDGRRSIATPGKIQSVAPPKSQGASNNNANLPEADRSGTTRSALAPSDSLPPRQPGADGQDNPTGSAPTQTPNMRPADAETNRLPGLSGSTPTPEVTPLGADVKPEPNLGGSTTTPASGPSPSRAAMPSQGDGSGGSSKRPEETPLSQINTNQGKSHLGKDHPWKFHRIRAARRGCGDPVLSAAQQVSGGIPCGHMKKGADGVYYDYSHN